MPVKTEGSKTTLPSGLPVYVATPAAPGIYPTVVWCHERYGFVQHTVTYAHKLAAEGYAVAAPDIYYDFPDQEGLHKGSARVGPISDDVIHDRLVQSVKHIGDNDKADVSRLGMIGVCASGRWPIVYGSKHPLQAAVIYYGATNGWDVSEGHPESIPQMVETMDSSFLGIFGERDHNIPVSEVCAFRNLLEEKNKNYRILIYEDAPHGFINDTMPGRYRPGPEIAAFHEMMRLFSSTLGESPPKDFISWQFESVKSVDYDFSKNVRLE